MLKRFVLAASLIALVAIPFVSELVSAEVRDKSSDCIQTDKPTGEYTGQWKYQTPWGVGPYVAQVPPVAVKPAEPVFAGTLRHRIAADRFLRRLEREGKLTPDQAAAVAKVRNGPDVMDDFVAGLPAVKGLSGAMSPGDHPILDWLSQVGQSLWANREEILKFIIDLVKLFAAAGQPAPWPPSLFA